MVQEVDYLRLPNNQILNHSSMLLEIEKIEKETLVIMDFSYKCKFKKSRHFLLKAY